MITEKISFAGGAPLKKYWRQIAAGILAAVLLCLWLDIRFGTFSGQRCRLPVLMYHHFVTDQAAEEKEQAGEELPGTVVSEGRFREQMTALHRAGYHAVTLEQIRDFVLDGEPLPDKPVLITMDDGYASNLEIAAPILEELGMCATVFVIGINEGEPVYVHSGEPFWQARFAYEEAVSWVEKGVLDLQSHTFDMHQLASYGYGPRDGMLPLEGEAEEDYRQALREDMDLFRERREGRVATELMALAFPFGCWSEETGRLLEEEGISLTFTIDERGNTLYTGRTDSMRRMGRFNVTESIDGSMLVNRLDAVS